MWSRFTVERINFMHLMFWLFPLTSSASGVFLSTHTRVQAPSQLEQCLLPWLSAAHACGSPLRRRFLSWARPPPCGQPLLAVWASRDCAQPVCLCWLAPHRFFPPGAALPTPTLTRLLAEEAGLRAFLSCCSAFTGLACTSRLLDLRPGKAPHWY